MNDFKIDGERIYLRKLKLSNATNKYVSWLNDPKVNKYLSTKKATISNLKRYIREKNSKKDCLFLGIFLKKIDKHIGNIKLEPIDFENKNVTLGIMIGDKKYWNKGFGTETIKLLANWVFEKLTATKIYLGVDKRNVAAIKAYIKAGFRDLKGSKTKMFLQKEDS